MNILADFVASTLAAIFVAIVAVCIVILLSMVEGVALSFLWAWFVVPLGAPAISIVQATGICLVVGLVVPHPERSEDFNMPMHAIAKPLIILGVAYCLKALM